MRKSENQIKQELFQLFRRNPEWTLQDLAKQIQQNPKSISDVLNGIAVYEEKTRIYRLKSDYQIDD